MSLFIDRARTWTALWLSVSRLSAPWSSRQLKQRTTPTTNRRQPPPSTSLRKASPEQVLQELSRRTGIGTQLAVEKLLTASFPQQRAFIEDPAPFKAAICTRRAGKSFSGALVLLRAALQHPGSSNLFIAKTRASAKGIVWKDVLKVLNRTHNLNLKFHETDLTATLPNGSVIYCLGADADDDEREKLLGQKYACVVIDESASFTTDLKELVMKTLKPAVADYRGQVCMIGTPGNIVKSFYFNVTTGVEPGWSVHRWTTYDNPNMVEEWTAEINQLVGVNPLVKETPWFRQMYLGEWVVDSEKLVYRFSPERNLVEAMPTNKSQPRYVLGVDLGYNDDSAFALCAYYRESPVLYYVKTIKRSGMDVTDVARQIKEFHSQFAVDVTVVDGANKQAIAELNNRHGLALQTADKTGKEDFIQLMNGDFIQGHVKAVEGGTYALVKEWRELIWYERTGSHQRRIEHPSLPNHLADAALYAWRHCYTYLFKPALALPPKEGTIEWFAEETKRMEEEAEKAWQKKQELAAAGDLWQDLELGEDSLWR